ncbi:MAG: hypothetical protein RSC35_07115 [Mucinivorans sp.]
MTQQSKISKNIIANVAGRIWAFLSIFLFVPIYIKLMGVEAYGVITFYTVLLTFLAFADAGFSATLNREFARESPFDNYKKNLLVTFEKIYIALALIVIIGTWIFAEQIARSFMDAKDISLEQLTYYVRLMGISIGLYFFSTLYQGGLMGLQQQVKANVLSISYNATKAGLVIVPLFFCPTLELYFYWQIGVTLMYLVVNRFFVAKVLGGLKIAKTHFEYVKPIWRYTVGMMALAIVYAANTQIDKLTVGSLLPLSDFGYYFMASSVSQVSLLLATPIGMAIFPELSRLVSVSDKDRISELFKRFSYIIATIVSIVVFVLFAYCYDYIAIWQHDAQIAAYITPATRVLLIGFLFMGLQLMPYYLALANGYTRINVVLGLCSIGFIIPSMDYFVTHYGFIGASYPWLMINSVIALILAAVVIRKFLRGWFVNWLFTNTLLPIMATAIVTAGLWFGSTFLQQGFYTLIYGAIIGLISLFANLRIYIYLYPDIKNNNIYKKIFRK